MLILECFHLVKEFVKMELLQEQQGSSGFSRLHRDCKGSYTSLTKRSSFLLVEFTVELTLAAWLFKLWSVELSELKPGTSQLASKPSTLASVDVMSPTTVVAEVAAPNMVPSTKCTCFVNCLFLTNNVTRLPLQRHSTKSLTAH